MWHRMESLYVVMIIASLPFDLHLDALDDSRELLGEAEAADEHPPALNLCQPHG